MKTITLILILISTTLTLVSCNTSLEYIEVEGIIRYVDIEGGFWGIEVNDGRKFDPLNLPEKFKIDGLTVHAKLRPKDELAGIHMWGQIVEVAEIREARQEK